jgi:isopentenyl-diphosphate delta-isomerase
MMKTEHVVLVDNLDKEIGTIDKLEAHQKGLLHRAFSIFIFNSKGEMLLQQRAFSKYHSAGLWTNSCCSHPYPNESILDAAHRRLFEEMGLQTSLHEIFSFIYHEKLDNGLSEHELDHVLIGHCDEPPVINTDEVANWKYVTTANLLTDVKENPTTYTIWFRIALDKVLQHTSNALVSASQNAG